MTNRALHIAVPLRDMPPIAEYGCAICLRPVGVDVELCGRCRKELDPTTLDTVLNAVDMPEREFAELVGMSPRSVVRAARGEKMSRRLAERLGQILSMRPEIFRELAPRAE